jgi:predicted enzyme related to lactoylglutathione lyase
MSPNSFRCTISVKSIHDTMAAVEAAGGKLRSPVVEIPHVGKVLEFSDIDNNVACIFEFIAGHPMEAK